jgi:DNA-binding response OmpR family regulator
MTSAPPPPTLAVFNASEDTVAFVSLFFEGLGYRVVTQSWPAYDPLRAEVADAFLSQYQADVVIFDVSLPYSENWQHFLQFKKVLDQRKIAIVLTTTNKHALTEMTGTTNALEIVGKPYDLEQLAAAVRDAMLRKASSRSTSPTTNPDSVPDSL